MKFYLCSLGIFSTLVLVKCQPPAEMKKTVGECLKEVGLPQGPLILPLNFNDPKVKCLSACIMKKKEDLVDGKVVVEKAIELADKYLPGGATDSVKADFTECAGKANEEKEECDVAGAFHKCIMQKRPLPFRQ